MRALVREHHFQASDLIAPFFIQKGRNKKTSIAMLPDLERMTVDILLRRAEEACDLGIQCVALFPYHGEEDRDHNASGAYDDNNIVVEAVRALKKAFPALGIIGDVALDAYTSHGHDGLCSADGTVDNDETVKVLCRQALMLADAGCDILAPSDMMDGRIGAIRKTLDKNNYHNVALMSYAVKYASSLYVPFRDATGAPDKNRDKRTYQMDPANQEEALREVGMDLQEGADIIMIKPGLHYLDVLANVVSTFKVPTMAFHVSGEYAMLCAAAERNFLSLDHVLEETMISFKRAGARAIATYGAMRVAKHLKSMEEY